MSSHDAVVKILREQYNLGEQPINGSQTLDSLGLDSLDQVELVMEVEDTLTIALPDEEFSNYQTITLDQFVAITDKYVK